MRSLQEKSIYNVTSSEIGNSSHVQSLQPAPILAFQVLHIHVSRVIQQAVGC